MQFHCTRVCTSNVLRIRTPTYIDTFFKHTKSSSGSLACRVRWVSLVYLGLRNDHTFGTLFYLVFPFLISKIPLIKYSSKYGKKRTKFYIIFSKSFTRMYNIKIASDEKYPPFPGFLSDFSLIFGNFFR